MSRKVMQQSLDAHHNSRYGAPCNRAEVRDVITALREELAKLEQGPVACLTEVEGMTMVWPIADYAEAVTYCDEGENPVLLFKEQE